MWYGRWTSREGLCPAQGGSTNTGGAGYELSITSQSYHNYISNISQSHFIRISTVFHTYFKCILYVYQMYFIRISNVFHTYFKGSLPGPPQHHATVCIIMVMHILKYDAYMTGYIIRISFKIRFLGNTSSIRIYIYWKITAHSLITSTSHRSLNLP